MNIVLAMPNLFDVSLGAFEAVLEVLHGPDDFEQLILLLSLSLSHLTDSAAQSTGLFHGTLAVLPLPQQLLDQSL